MTGLDTNQITQVAQNAQAAIDAANAIRGQINPWMISAIGLGAAWIGREISRATAAARAGADWAIGHGGLLRVGIKVFWVWGYGSATGIPPGAAHVDHLDTINGAGRSQN